MPFPSDNETWVIEEGDRVIQKKVRNGLGGLSEWEKLVYCLWVADFGMRNAGDLKTSRDFHSDFQSVALKAAETLSLDLTRESFAMDSDALESEYFGRFEAICREIRRIDPSVEQ